MSEVKRYAVFCLLALAGAGCGIGEPHAYPCLVDHKDGFTYYQSGEQVTNCIPCAKAKEKDARFVCFGVKP